MLRPVHALRGRQSCKQCGVGECDPLECSEKHFASMMKMYNYCKSSHIIYRSTKVKYDTIPELCLVRRRMRLKKERFDVVEFVEWLDHWNPASNDNNWRIKTSREEAEKPELGVYPMEGCPLEVRVL